MEHVLVIPRSLLDQLGSFQGFRSDAAAHIEAFLAPGANFFMARPQAEADPTHKQLIPYCVFRHQGRYLSYQRGGSSGEKRLVAKRSLGIGGHINPIDQENSSLQRSLYDNGVEREIAEELRIEGGYRQQVIGLINDDSTEVGAVHLGVVHCFELEQDQIHSNEDAIEDLRFMSLEELAAIQPQLETWSQILLAHLLSQRA